ncbi:hypothetical protein A4A49_63470, partial [Nicotiana attenuata]
MKTTGKSDAAVEGLVKKKSKGERVVREGRRGIMSEREMGEMIRLRYICAVGGQMWLRMQICNGRYKTGKWGQNRLLVQLDGQEMVCMQMWSLMQVRAIQEIGYNCKAELGRVKRLAVQLIGQGWREYLWLQVQGRVDLGYFWIGPLWAIKILVWAVTMFKRWHNKAALIINWPQVQIDNGEADGYCCKSLDMGLLGQFGL